MTMKKQLLAAALGLAILGVGISAARANSVDFATDATWNATGWPGTTLPGGPEYSGPAVVITPLNSNWASPSAIGTGAQWIGVQASNGSYGYADEPPESPGVYTFTTTLSLVPPPAAATSVVLDFTFSADNWLNGLSVSSAGYTYTVDSATLIALQSQNPPNLDGNNIYAFSYVFNLTNAGAFTSPVTITAIVQNWGGPESADDPNNPVGFIAAGSLTYQTAAVPLPAAAGVGFSMLAGFGALLGLRRRRHRKPRIE